MTTYTLQVSNHPQAGRRIPPAEANESWKTIYEGPIATDAEARQAVTDLAKWCRHARVWRHGEKDTTQHEAVLR